MSRSSNLFTTIYGRNLVGELRHVAHRPYLVVTMEDLWRKFRSSFDGNMVAAHFVRTLEHRQLEDELAHELARLPACNSVIGLGGGQALDVAKYVAWSRRLPLFQVPTALTVDAAFGQRFALRYDGQIRYIGWAVPEAVYVDYDVIQSAPPTLNRSGVGDILCYHTAHADWALARTRGRTEPQWPYDQQLVDEARGILDTVMAALDEIREGTEAGIRTLAEALRWGGAAYHNAGWNARHIEGAEHFFYYALEYRTGHKFIHGQPVCLGIYLTSALHDHQPEEILAAIHRAGVDIRPQAMGVTWNQVSETLYGLRSFVEENELPYTIANEAQITDAFIEHARRRIEATYGPWTGPDARSTASRKNLSEQRSGRSLTAPGAVGDRPQRALG
jgi:glycerol-1-phosphate dehydrogenase [NAD(P)+]